MEEWTGRAVASVPRDGEAGRGWVEQRDRRRSAGRNDISPRVALPRYSFPMPPLEIERKFISMAERAKARPLVVSLGEERRRATRLLGEARSMVDELMQLARMGASVDAARLEPVVQKMIGSLRRNPDIKWRRHPKDPYRFSQLQGQLLHQATHFVKHNGVLVYATCTLLREENEAVVERFASQHPHFVLEEVADLLPAHHPPIHDGRYLKTWPHHHDVDGFFAVRWRRA